MPTEKEIAAGAEALRKVQSDSRLKGVKWPTERDQVVAVLEAAEKVRSIPFAALDAINEKSPGG